MFILVCSNLVYIYYVHDVSNIILHQTIHINSSIKVDVIIIDNEGSHGIWDTYHFSDTLVPYHSNKIIQKVI